MFWQIKNQIAAEHSEIYLSSMIWIAAPLCLEMNLDTKRWFQKCQPIHGEERNNYKVTAGKRPQNWSSMYRANSSRNVSRMDSKLCSVSCFISSTWKAAYQGSHMTERSWFSDLPWCPHVFLYWMKIQGRLRSQLSAEQLWWPIMMPQCPWFESLAFLKRNYDSGYRLEKGLSYIDIYIFYRCSVFSTSLKWKMFTKTMCDKKPVWNTSLYESHFCWYLHEFSAGPAGWRNEFYL